MAGGADFILFETQPNRAALEKCAAAMQSKPEVPYVLSFALEANGETATGETVERLLAPLPDEFRPPIAWGMNCGSGPDGLLSAIERAVRLTTLPLIVQPNAGMPKEVDNRRIYLCSPEYLTEYAKRFVGLGASAVVDAAAPRRSYSRDGPGDQAAGPDAIEATVVAAAEPAEMKPPAPLAEKSNFARRLAEAVGHHGRIGAAARLRPAFDRSRRAARSASAASRRSTSPTVPGRARGFRR